MTLATTTNFLPALTPEQIDLIKRTICKGATDDELKLFLHVCTKLNLDPFMRQIYAVKRKEKRGDGSWGESMTLQTSIDGLRAMASRTGKYMPGRETVFTYDENRRPMSATAYVKRLGPDGQWHEVGATAFWNEFVQQYNGEPSSFWKRMPHNQLAKCAESLAIRKAFPADLSGIYTNEEMQQADVQEIAKESMQTIKEEKFNENTGEIYVEMITFEEAQDIENLIREDKDYRAALLSYFSTLNKTPIASFFDLPKRYLSSCMKGINKRLNVRKADEKNEETA